MRRAEIERALPNAAPSSVSRVLDDLVKCGYLRSYRNRYEKYQPSVFQLVDPFILFSLKFMDGANHLSDWAAFERTPAYYAWRGNAFEIICQGHLEQIKHAIGISAVRTEAFPWLSSRGGQGTQIDLVLERADRVTNICEAKYTDEPFVPDKTFEDDCRRKCNVFREQSGTANALQVVLVSAQGIKQNVHSWDVVSTVTMDDLFAF